MCKLFGSKRPQPESAIAYCPDSPSPAKKENGILVALQDAIAGSDCVGAGELLGALLKKEIFVGIKRSKHGDDVFVTTNEPDDAVTRASLGEILNGI